MTTSEAGQSFSELPGDRHAIRANANETQPAKLLAVFVVDTNETELTFHSGTDCHNDFAMLPSDFFRRNLVLSFQEGAIGIRRRDVVGADNMMRGSNYPHSESAFPQSRKILAGVPDDEQAKQAPDPVPGIAGGNTARVYNFDVARLTVPA